jgi:hypothetical protein
MMADCAFIAAVLIENYRTNVYQSKYGKAETKQYTVVYLADSQEAKQIEACFFGVSKTVEEANLAKCNEYLNKVNFELVKSHNNLRKFLVQAKN